MGDEQFDVTHPSVEHLQQKSSYLPTSFSEATHEPQSSVFQADGSDSTLDLVRPVVKGTCAAPARRSSRRDTRKTP